MVSIRDIRELLLDSRICEEFSLSNDFLVNYLSMGGKKQSLMSSSDHDDDVQIQCDANLLKILRNEITIMTEENNNYERMWKPEEDGMDLIFYLMLRKLGVSPELCKALCIEEGVLTMQDFCFFTDSEVDELLSKLRSIAITDDNNGPLEDDMSVCTSNTTQSTRHTGDMQQRRRRKLTTLQQSKLKLFRKWYIEKKDRENSDDCGSNNNVEIWHFDLLKEQARRRRSDQSSTSSFNDDMSSLHSLNSTNTNNRTNSVSSSLIVQGDMIQVLPPPSDGIPIAHAVPVKVSPSMSTPPATPPAASNISQQQQHKSQQTQTATTKSTTALKKANYSNNSNATIIPNNTQTTNNTNTQTHTQQTQQQKKKPICISIEWKNVQKNLSQAMELDENPNTRKFSTRYYKEAAVLCLEIIRACEEAIMVEEEKKNSLLQHQQVQEEDNVENRGDTKKLIHQLSQFRDHVKNKTSQILGEFLNIFCSIGLVEKDTFF